MHWLLYFVFTVNLNWQGECFRFLLIRHFLARRFRDLNYCRAREIFVVGDVLSSNFLSLVSRCDSEASAKQSISWTKNKKWILRSFIFSNLDDMLKNQNEHQSSAEHNVEWLSIEAAVVALASRVFGGSSWRVEAVLDYRKTWKMF